jgi:hypothetical protein
MSGTYYDYILSTIEDSLNNFLSDTTFPYTKTSGNFKADGGFGGGAPSGMSPGGSPPNGIMPGDIIPGGMNQSAETTSTTYNTTQDYIDSLNSDEEWIIYDAKTNTAKVTSIEAFVKHCKNASKAVPAFDNLNRSQPENDLFGNDVNDTLHFDRIVADLLQKNKGNYSAYSDWNPSIVEAYLTDLEAVDKFGKGIQYRQDMYNPMYYLCNYYDGYNTSIPALHWRIRTGIDQGDTALTVETNLAQALKTYKGVKDVDFETVWGLEHTMAERTGNSTDNFIDWVNGCVEQK